MRCFGLEVFAGPIYNDKMRVFVRFSCTAFEGRLITTILLETRERRSELRLMRRHRCIDMDGNLTLKNKVNLLNLVKESMDTKEVPVIILQRLMIRTKRAGLSQKLA
jgi:hypothetical protein